MNPNDPGLPGAASRDSGWTVCPHCGLRQSWPKDDLCRRCGNNLLVPPLEHEVRARETEAHQGSAAPSRWSRHSAGTGPPAFLYVAAFLLALGAGAVTWRVIRAPQSTSGDAAGAADEGGGLTDLIADVVTGAEPSPTPGDFEIAGQLTGSWTANGAPPAQLTPDLVFYPDGGLLAAGGATPKRGSWKVVGGKLRIEIQGGGTYRAPIQLAGKVFVLAAGTPDEAGYKRP